ncbi:MAG: hypothetical protein QOJ75_1740 [Chloroflexota bacterium]|nr:hypothetical protein [Chloroflexota bacterium]
MQSSVWIDVAATPEVVFRLACDVTRWPDLLPHYVSVRVLDAARPDGSAVARMVARRPLIDVLGLGLPVTWQARVWNEPATRRLRFVHVAGATKGMSVTWRIEPNGTGCRVSIEHDFHPPVPLFAEIVDRWFVRPIARRTLATFRALAEAVTAAAGATGESERPPLTNPST